MTKRGDDVPDDDTLPPGEVALYPIWRQAAQDAVVQFAYGELIPHEWIYAALEIQEPAGLMTSEQYKAISFDLLRKVDRFREELLERHQRLLVNHRGLGYRVVEPPHQAGVAMRRMESEVRKSLSKAMLALIHTNETMLSLDDARERVEAKAKLAWMTTVGIRRIGREKIASEATMPEAGE